MLELAGQLHRRAAGLAPAAKQKISMGRGLVREDVNVVMFDEPLTVIDPHLTWKLRSKLKELNKRTRRTMIYVTHDQTEALTFADQVVVMQEGEVVQVGTPVDLFERPAHNFVGDFIGSPGMNILPAELRDGMAPVAGVPVMAAPRAQAAGRLELGVRPEFVSFAPGGLPAQVIRVTDVGRSRIVELQARGGLRVLASLAEGAEVPQGAAHVVFDPARTGLHADGWRIDAAAG
jgi:glycerol transport system ATP-binding protein